jgi:predicted amidophosphoribosyltransferase
MNGSGPVEAGCCPVCQARFRGTVVCSRCGAELEPLMLLAVRAYSLRQVARKALRAGDPQSALALSKAAQTLHATPEGNLLYVLSAAVVHG